MKKIILYVLLFTNPLFSTVIHDEIIKGNLSNIRKILNSNASLINSVDNSRLPGGKPIHFAAYYNKQKILEYLISLNVNVNVKGVEGNTPLFWAMDRCNKSIIEILVNNGANLNLRNEYNSHVLLYIGKDTPVDIVKFLVENGADYNVVEGPMSPLKKAVIAENINVANYLKSIDAVNPNDFFISLEKGDINKIKKYLKLAPGLLNADWTGGRSALHIAAERGFLDIVRYLLNIGVNPNTVTEELESALHYASSSGEVEVVKTLLRAGAKIIKDEDGFTPLTYAIGVIKKEKTLGVGYYYPGEVKAKKYLEIAQVLINKGIDINSRDREGKTNLYYAIISNEVEMIKLLLQNKADVKNIDGKGNGAMEIAKREKLPEIVKLLK